MFNFNIEQQQVFSNLFIKKFENEMIAHVKEFFPNNYAASGKHDTRKTIRYGYERAKNYGFDTERNICLYLNTMLFFGSNFDNDPQYPWAQTILKDSASNSMKYSDIDKLADKAEEIYEQIAGPNQIYLNDAYKNMLNNQVEIFKRLSAESLSSLIDYLPVVFSKKYEVINIANLQQMVKFGINNARAYGIVAEPDICVYIVFMFLLGGGFNTDPQFSWASRILNITIGPSKKIELLYQAGINWLEAYLLKLNN